MRYVTQVRGIVVFLAAAFALQGATAAADDETVPLPALPDDDFGPVLLIEAINIRGNTATQDDIIRRALPIAPGDILHATDKRLRNARFIDWPADPHAGMSYSYIPPGGAGMRAKLAEPLEGVLFFAGEACSRSNFSTAHGGWETGVTAAEQVLHARNSTHGRIKSKSK